MNKPGPGHGSSNAPWGAGNLPKASGANLPSARRSERGGANGTLVVVLTVPPPPPPTPPQPHPRLAPQFPGANRPCPLGWQTSKLLQEARNGHLVKIHMLPPRIILHHCIHGLFSAPMQDRGRQWGWGHHKHKELVEVLHAKSLGEKHKVHTTPPSLQKTWQLLHPH